MGLFTTIGNLGKTVGGGIVAGAAGLTNDVLPGSPAAGVQQFGNNVANPNVNYQGVANPTQYSFGHAVSNLPAGSSNVPQKATTPNTENPANPGGGSGSNSSGDAATAAYYDSQANTLRGLLGRSQNTLDQGLTNLSDSYNKQVNDANQQRSRALEDYGIQSENSAHAKDQALGQVDTNARTLNDSLRRMLGQASGSDSSAYQYAAPNAVAREASGDRNKTLDAYSENDRNIGLAQKRATEDFQSLLDNLAAQRGQKESDLRSGVLQSEQDVNSQLADVAAKKAALTGSSYASTLAAQQPYQQAISDRQASIDALFNQFRNPTYDVKPVDVQTPTLRDYVVNSAGINSGSSAASQDPSQTYGYYLKKNQDQQAAY